MEGVFVYYDLCPYALRVSKSIRSYIFCYGFQNSFNPIYSTANTYERNTRDPEIQWYVFSSFYCSLNSKDVGKVCGSAEPQVKSFVLPLCCELSLMFWFAIFAFHSIYLVIHVCECTYFVDLLLDIFKQLYKYGLN